VSVVIPGTEGYAEQAGELVARYEALPSTDKHGAVLHLLPDEPGLVLDIGSGTGADAVWFASRGHRVVAVEPADELRMAGMALHPSPSIEWVNDSLPDLAQMRARGQRFNAVMLTAVWMHLNEPERRRAMPAVASLLAPHGVLVMSLRHGPVPSGRRMFVVSAEETVSLAQSCALLAMLNIRAASVGAVNREGGVMWTRLVFQWAV